jgi:hypothetical protein
VWHSANPAPATNRRKAGSSPARRLLAFTRPLISARRSLASEERARRLAGNLVELEFSRPSKPGDNALIEIQGLSGD